MGTRRYHRPPSRLINTLPLCKTTHRNNTVHEPPHLHNPHIRKRMSLRVHRYQRNNIFRVNQTSVNIVQTEIALLRVKIGRQPRWNSQANRARLRFLQPPKLNIQSSPIWCRVQRLQTKVPMPCSTCASGFRQITFCTFSVSSWSP